MKWNSLHRGDEMIRLLALLLLAVPAFGTDPPGIKELSPIPKTDPPAPPADAAVTVDVGRYRYFSVEGYTGPVTWMASGTSLGMKEVTKPITMFGQIQFLPEPGEYEVPAGAVIVWGREQGETKLTALGVVDGKAKLLFSKKFQTGEIIPDPTPKPKPAPVAKALWIVTVEETALRTIPTATVLGDLTYWKGLEKKGHSFRFYDKDIGEGVRYAAKAKEKGIPLPAMLLFDKAGPQTKAEPLAIIALPTTTAGVDAQVALSTGGK